MDISVRDWIIVIGGLLIVAVLLDGYRRMRNNRDRLRVSLAPASEGGEDAAPGPRRELPGNARVVKRDGGGGEGGETDAPPAPAVRAGGEEGDRDSPGGVVADNGERPETAVRRESGIDPEVFMLHVVARDEAGFAGEDILQVLLAFDMRFGEMSFFHRRAEAAGRGPIQFSVANMMQPGVFDIDAIAGLHTSGLSFFASFPGPEDMNRAFDLMVETARGVAENLGGDMLDETRSVATRQTLEHMRQRIRDLERRMLAQSGR